MGMSSTEKRKIYKFVQERTDNAVYFNKSKPGYLVHIGTGSEENRNFEKYADIPQGLHKVGVIPLLLE